MENGFSTSEGIAFTSDVVSFSSEIVLFTSEGNSATSPPLLAGIDRTDCFPRARIYYTICRVFCLHCLHLRG